MKACDLTLLALSNLWLTRFRAILTTLGVVIGIGVLVSMVSFGTGIQKNVTDEIKKNDLLTTLQVLPSGTGLDDVMSGNIEALTEPREHGIPLDDSAVESIEAIPGVVVAYPELRFPAKIRFRGRETSVNMRALPAELASVKPYNGLSHGTFFESDSEASILLSGSALEELGVAFAGDEGEAEDVVSLPSDSIIGREVEVVTSVLDPTAMLLASEGARAGRPAMPFREHIERLKIAGTLDRASGPFEMSSGGAAVPLATAAGMPRVDFTSVWDLLDSSADSESGYTAVHARVGNIDDLDAVVAEVEEMGFEVFTLADQLDEFKRNFMILDALLGAVGVVALIIAGLGIINTMVTSILERTREIGVMKAIGGSESDIARIFFVEAATIGVLGGVFGVALGWLVTRIANAIANAYIRPQGFEPVNLFHIPLWLIAGALAFSVGVSLLAGLYPAVRASRVDPVKALRHD